SRPGSHARRSRPPGSPSACTGSRRGTRRATRGTRPRRRSLRRQTDRAPGRSGSLLPKQTLGEPLERIRRQLHQAVEEHVLPVALLVRVDLRDLVLRDLVLVGLGTAPLLLVAPVVLSSPLLDPP